MTRARFRGYHTYFPVAEYRRYISILLPVFFCDFKQTLTLNGPANRHTGVEQFFIQSPVILHKTIQVLVRFTPKASPPSLFSPFLQKYLSPAARGNNATIS